MKQQGSYRISDRIPVLADDRVPPGMAFVGYDKDGNLVALVNIEDDVPERP